MKTNRSNKLFEQTRIATLGLQDLLAFGQLQPDGTYKVRNVTNSNFLNAIVISEQVTQAELLALQTAGELVAGKNYTIMNAIGGTISLFLYAVSSTALTEYGYNTTDGQLYSYDLATDTGSIAPSFTNLVPYTGATTDVDLGENGLTAGFVTYDTTPTGTPPSQATTYWDSTEETLALIMNGVTQRVGLDTYFNAKNSTGTSIPKGTAVRFAGTDGNSGNLLIAPMLADGTYPSVYYMGITAEAIGNGQFGKVMSLGKLRTNTNAYNDNDILYVSSTVAGGFQTTAPLAPNNIIIAAAVVNAANNGVLEVRATLGSNINNDEGVKITTPLTGQLLQLQSNGLWENKTLPIHDAVTLGTANGLSLAGQVLSLGLSSSSANGALSSTDWSTFNAKQAALNGTGFVKISGTTISYDNSTYITGNQTITLSGEASGSGATSISVTLDNAAVINKVLTGLSVSGSAIVSTDSILVALGKVQNQINALAGGVSYQGTWNASTNTPSLTSSVGTKGYYYVVSVAGSTNLNGITDWKLGDWVIFNGSTWDKVDNTDAVISVNGYTGIVTLAKADIGLGNVENTALSTWTGSTNITTLGTIGTGVWQGTAIGDTYISSASTWNAKIGGSGTSGKLAKFTASGTVGDSVLQETATSIGLNGAALPDTGDTRFQINGTTYGTLNVRSTSVESTFRSHEPLLTLFLGTISNHDAVFLTNGTERIRVQADGSIITNAATDTGEHFIVGGSARVNGTGEFTNNVTITASTGNSPLRFTSTTASSKTGYLYADANIIGLTDTLNAGVALGGVFFNSTTKESLFFNNGNISLTIASTGAATFSSSVTANGKISGFASESHIFSVADGSAQIKLERTNTSAGAMYIGASSSGYNLYDSSFNVVHSISNTGAATFSSSVTAGGQVTTTSVSGYRLLSGSDTLFSLGYSGGTLLNRLTGTSLFLAENGTPQLTIASGGAATFSNSVTVGASTNGRLGVRGTTNDSSAYAFEAANSSGNTLFIVRNDGAATFSSSVAIGNTVAAAIGVASTHKVTMVIGGVTYYLLATNV